MTLATLAQWLVRLALIGLVVVVADRIIRGGLA